MQKWKCQHSQQGHREFPIGSSREYPGIEAVLIPGREFPGILVITELNLIYYVSIRLQENYSSTVFGSAGCLKFWICFLLSLRLSLRL